MHIALFRLSMLGGLLLAVTGCGSDSKYASVTGVVTFDGAPIAEAAVSFTPKAGGRPAYGMTDAEGKYELTSIQMGDGALIGEHTVTITAVKVEQSEQAKKMAEEMGSLSDIMPAPRPKETWLIPRKFSDPKSSGLSFTVERGANQADFALTQ